MSLTRWAVQYPRLTYLLVAALTGCGIMALLTLPRREDPDFQGRYVQVIALYPGARARQVEALVTEPMERALLEIDDLKSVQSTSRPGNAVFIIEASDYSRDLAKFRQDVRNQVYDLRPALPDGVLSVEVNDRYTDTSALILGITLDPGTNREREDIARLIRDRLRPLPDVGQVNLVGEQQEQIVVELSAQKLARYALSPATIADAIAQRNTLPFSGGSLPLDGIRLDVIASGIRDERDLEGLVVAAPGGIPIYLRDVARVERTYEEPPPFILRVNGRAAVGVSITMRRGRNISALGVAVRHELAILRPQLPRQAAVIVLNDLPRSVAGRIQEFFENLLAGVALIIVVMYLFMGLRSSILVGALIPLTILGTFTLMLALHRDIQQISITALIIALGLVVDNSIVVVDNIERKLVEGCDPMRAATEGADELRVPLLTSNLTTVASFAPLLLLSGGVGEFIRDLGVVTSLATIVSLLLNLTFTPLLAMRFLRVLHKERVGPVRRIFFGLVEGLRRVLSAAAAIALSRAGLTVGLAILAFAIAVAAIPSLGVQFFPSAVRDQFTIDVWLPDGRDIRTTELVVEKVEAILARQHGVRSYASYIGQGGPRFYYNVYPEPPTPNYAQLVVNTAAVEDTRRLVTEVQRESSAAITGARILCRTLEQGLPVSAPIGVRIAGERISDLRAVGKTIEGMLKAVPGATSVSQDYGDRPLAIRVDVNQDQAARAGLSSNDVMRALAIGLDGLTISMLREPDREIPIQLRLEPGERANVGALEDLNLRSESGAAIPVRQVASLSLAPQEARIVRRDAVRTLTVFAHSDGTRLASAILSDAREQISRMQIPGGISISYGGEDEQIGQTFGEMLLILILSIIANLVIVVWEFNSFKTAITILAAAPLSMIGAILGLLVTRQHFGFMAFLGITSLAGVVTNHAIVLFEYAREEKAHGATFDEALIAAGRKRLRPILLTVALSVGGLLPQAVNGGTLWPPMAWSLIFGLAACMVLTLVILPSVYKVLAGQSRRAK